MEEATASLTRLLLQHNLPQAVVNSIIGDGELQRVWDGLAGSNNHHQMTGQPQEIYGSSSSSSSSSSLSTSALMMNKAKDEPFDFCSDIDCDAQHLWVWIFIPVVFVCSMIGVSVPTLLEKYLPQYRLLQSTTFKFLQGVAAGFIISVAVVHCISESVTVMEECVDDTFSWAALAALLGIVATWSIELAIACYMSQKKAEKRVEIIGDDGIAKYGSISEPFDLTGRKQLKPPSPSSSSPTLHHHHDHHHHKEKHHHHHDDHEHHHSSSGSSSSSDDDHDHHHHHDDHHHHHHDESHDHEAGHDENHHHHHHHDEQEEHDHHHHHDDGHGHGDDGAHGTCPSETIASVFENTEKGMGNKADLFILLFGLSFHTFFIGTALGLTDDSTLFFALMAHQIFEALALGLHLAKVPIKNWKLPAVVTLTFSLSGPIGGGIGVAVVGLICGNTRSFKIVEGILNSFAGGILVFVGCVHMIAEEFTRADDVVTKWKKALAAWAGVMFGAGVMSAIGIWA